MRLVLLAFLLILPHTAAAQEKPYNNCKTIDAIYEPKLDYSKSRGKGWRPAFRFELDIVADEYTDYRWRGPFFIFTAFDKKTGEKLSDMILGYQNMSHPSISAHYGQTYREKTLGDYAQMYEIPIPEGYKEKGTNPIKSRYPNFKPIALREDFAQIFGYFDERPYAFIFPDTSFQLNHNALQDTHNWDKYIRFYTDERVFPNFGGLDVWSYKRGQKGNSTK